MAVSLGCHVQGAALPHADPADPVTLLGGVIKRAGAKQPKIYDHELRKWGEFVDEFLETYLSPLNVDTNLELGAWLDSRPYADWRKEELRRVDQENPSLWGNKKLLQCNEFMKDESYPEYKYPRLIRSRSDKCKTFFGPLTGAIEKEVYALPWFIKKIPVADRPKYIFDKLFREGASYAQTDFTTFEASFKEKVMQHCEFRLYRYMMQHLPGCEEFVEFLDNVLAGENVCVKRWMYVMKILATRMSGEMSTSLSNGFTNLMLFLYAVAKTVENIPNTVPAGTVEGDDGLFTINGRFPTERCFTKLGFNIKLVEFKRLEYASFCGLVFDLQDLIVVDNPMPAMVRFGWTTQQYANGGSKVCLALLRAKALSMAHQMPGCPVLCRLAHYALRMTRGACVKRLLSHHQLNEWVRKRYIEAYEGRLWIPDIQPPMGTRLLVERLYGITIEQQISMENYFDLCDTLRPIDHPAVLGHCKQVWCDYFSEYAERRSLGDDLWDPLHTWVYWHPTRIKVLDIVRNATGSR